MKKLNKIAIVGAVVVAGALGVGGFALAQQGDDTAAGVTTEQASTAQKPGVEQDGYYGRGYYGRGYAYGRGWGWGPRYYGRPYYAPRRAWYYYW